MSKVDRIADLRDPLNVPPSLSKYLCKKRKSRDSVEIAQLLGNLV